MGRLPGRQALVPSLGTQLIIRQTKNEQAARRRSAEQRTSTGTLALAMSTG